MSLVSGVWIHQINLRSRVLYLIKVYNNCIALYLYVVHHLFESELSEALVQRCSIKKCVLRNVTKFTGKHLYQSHFLNKVAGLRPKEKKSLAQVFFCEFCEISKNTFFTENLRWLLLNCKRGRNSQIAIIDSVILLVLNLKL